MSPKKLPSKPSSLKCWYTGKPTTLDEVLAVDNEFDELDDETHEFVLDEIKKISTSNPRAPPYVHMSKRGYDVLNICKNEFEKALKKVLE